MLFIGIDLGTSAVKTLLMSEKGEVKKTVSEEYPLLFPKAGWAEQNPEDWYTATIRALRSLLRGIDKAAVAGISFGGQMHGLVALDKADRVIRPAILWNDGRAAEEARFLNREIGQEALSAYTANIAFAGFTAPKLLWMRHNEPENFARIDKIMLPKDYLAYRLSGVFCTDVSDASGTLYFDPEKKTWSEEMLAICQIEAWQLPRIFESSAPVGTLLPEIAEELGLLPSVKIIAGAADNAAAAIGTGTVGEGGCNISLGTSGTIFISSRQFRRDAQGALHAFAHADGGYTLMGCMLSAASCNKWWMDDILQNKNYLSLQSAVTDEMLGSNEVFFLPYLMGERSPINDPDARGAFIGMSLATTPLSMTLAVLEGVAFAMRDCLEVAKKCGIEITSSKICGGGAKSPLWRKIFANVLNIAIEVPQAEEGPGLGAAVLAAVGCGAMPSVEAGAAQISKITETVLPNAAIAERYEAKYQKYQMLYPALKSFFSQA